MKRRDLIKAIRDAASAAGLEFISLRNTGGHEVFSLDGLRIAVPNHRQIAEGTARSIMRQAAAKRTGVVDMTTYTVTATRDGEWWSLVAEDVGGREVASQSRRLDQADAAIREAIALVLDVDPDTFDVDVVPVLDEAAVSAETLELLEVRRQLAELSERSRRLTPKAVAELRASGLSVRDVAELLGVTPSRISQIQHNSLASSAR